MEDLDPATPQTGGFLYLYDGNGNVGQVVSASNLSLVEKYDYDPYGNRIESSTSASACPQPFRFSTKYCDDELGWYYFGHRYLDPQTGRWTSQDPIGEQGDDLLYRFARNRPIGTVDPLGLRNDWGIGDRYEVEQILREQREQERERERRAQIPPIPTAVIDCGEGPKYLTRENADELFNPRRDPRIASDLNRGCIGVCSLYQGTGTKWPEQDPNTKCFLSEPEAEQACCPEGTHAFVFAKQGQWNQIVPGTEDLPEPKRTPPPKNRGDPWGKPEPGPDGSVPNSSIMHNRSGELPHYNYVTVVKGKDGKRCYLWANHSLGSKPQVFTIYDSPPSDQSNVEYPGEIWCRTCR
jgi:RHS repeat-associated protein